MGSLLHSIPENPGFARLCIFNPERIVLLPALVIFAESMANNMTYEELVKKHPGSLVEKIVTEVVNKDTIEVHFEDADDDQWAVIKVHIYEEDKEMAVRLLSEGRWVLQFGYYDDDDEFIELLQPLTQQEIDLIPKRLQKVMLKVLADEEGLRLPGNFLSK
jgi:hypothetical protein